MHELSIARSIVEIVEEYVHEGDRSLVRTVHLHVGEVSGIVPESLDFAFQALTFGTALRSASLSIAYIPFQLRCHNCGQTAGSPHGIVLCPTCGSPYTEIISGKELSVSSIEMEERS